MAHADEQQVGGLAMFNRKGIDGCLDVAGAGMDVFPPCPAWENRPHGGGYGSRSPPSHVSTRARRGSLGYVIKATTNRGPGKLRIASRRASINPYAIIVL